MVQELEYLVKVKQDHVQSSWSAKIAIEDGTIKGNETLVITAVGAGLTWGGAALKLGNRITPLGETDVDLPPYEGTGIDVIRGSINYFVPDKAE